MKVITIKQPWATLITEGYKEYEFRTWKTTYRGDILIHAGLGVDEEALKRFSYLNLDYPKGVIIAKVTLTDCLEVNNNLREELIKKDKLVYKNIINNLSYQGFAFKLENIKKITPIKAKGKLSLWDYNYKE